MKTKGLIFIIMVVLIWADIVFAGKVAVLPEINKPDVKLVVGNDRIFVVEGPEVYIYSLKDYRLLKKFGKKGEGPREFIGRILVYLHPGKIQVNSIKKISFFTLDGTFLKETRATGGRLFKPLGNRFAGQGNVKENGKNYRTLNIFDSKLKVIKEFCRFEDVRQGNVVKGYQDPFHFIPYDNKIFCAVKRDFIIDVYDDSGKYLYSIRRDYKKVKVSERDKKRLLNTFKERVNERSYQYIKNNIQFPEYLPAIHYFLIDNNRVYVLTNNVKDGKREIIIFDLAGKFLKQVFLEFEIKETIFPDPYTIYDGKRYQLVENLDTEEWELHVTKIE